MGRPRKTEQVEMFAESVKEVSAKQNYEGTPEKKYEPTAEIKKSTAKKLMPRGKIKVKTTRTPTPEEKKYRDYMWEYVEGIFENRFKAGLTLTFWMNPFPGDEYAEWVVPANVLISVPRWMAEHLNNRKYCTFKEEDIPADLLGPGDFLKKFVPGEVHHRTTFLPARLY